MSDTTDNKRAAFIDAVAYAYSKRGKNVEEDDSQDEAA